MNSPIRTPIPVDEQEQNRCLYRLYVRALRQEHRIPMTKVAAKLNVSVKTIEDRISGELLVRNETLFALQFLRAALNGGERWDDIE
ncbi:hypothetical protein [Brucella anthropi]|uniref:hypothetical protein n=1 Tax=Brucella anthropi TaxID=529 RepID=UPI00124C3600|nr:hypothetical protein [Brucella anthropi]KAB2751763.1 hypothetical protein F9L05_01100 [Brucella anthropi]